MQIYTFLLKHIFQFYTFSTSFQFFRYNLCRKWLYFIPVLIYTPIKVKSELREEKRWLRQTDKPICRSLPMIQLFFLLAAKSSWLHLAFSWHQLVKIPLIFVPSQWIENRWTSDGKRKFSRWFWFKWKVRQNGRFLTWKTSEKRLFYRLKRNSFTFKLFGMLHRQITKWKQNHKKRKYKVVKWVKSVTSKHYSIFFFHSYFLLL